MASLHKASVACVGLSFLRFFGVVEFMIPTWCRTLGSKRLARRLFIKESAWTKFSSSNNAKNMHFTFVDSNWAGSGSWLPKWFLYQKNAQIWTVWVLRYDRVWVLHAQEALAPRHRASPPEGSSSPSSLSIDPPALESASLPKDASVLLFDCIYIYYIWWWWWW